MRFVFLLVAVWLLALSTRATPMPPDRAVVRVNRLPATSGLRLARGWRYHAGDDPAWARPDFDDGRWDTLNPTRPRPELPSAVRTGVGWLRLGDSLRQRQLLLQSTVLAGACEIYLNGRLVQRVGRWQADPARVQPAGSWPLPVEVPGAGAPDVVLAVRYAPWQSLRPLTRSLDQGPLFRLSLVSSTAHRQAAAEQAAANLVFYVVGGVAALLTLLHLAFFSFNPAQRANVYFTCYAGALAVAALLIYYSFYGKFRSLEGYMLCGYSSYVLLVLSDLWAVRALYALFGFRPGRVYGALWVGCGGLLTYLAFHNGGAAGFIAYLGATALATLEQLRLTGRALRRRQRGAGIIAAGFGLTLLAVVGLVALSFSKVTGTMAADAYRCPS